eukprot:scaffold174042_cov36-Prasinocladus_malaysianus.AAC.1
MVDSDPEGSPVGSFPGEPAEHPRGRRHAGPAAAGHAGGGPSPPASRPAGVQQPPTDDPGTLLTQKRDTAVRRLHALRLRLILSLTYVCHEGQCGDPAGGAGGLGPAAAPRQRKTLWQ